MGSTTKGLAVLGSTGSIGTQTLDIVRTFPDDFSVVGLAARRSHRLLEQQVREFRPSMAYCEGSDYEKAFLQELDCAGTEIDEIAASPDVDIVVAATSGDVAVPATFAGIEAGKDIALANKETVVIAGDLVTQAARESNVSLLPLDSEPNAIWQCLRGEDKAVSKLIITASG
ncbi:MAG: 1-deoxy-D-xylulose-5-phosphate reductoisomerase, partial [Chloroflexi bacterium]|nr:1-deoxy-D-xylulose-5-phosphate reductoisomerase [Chloroflexota bacterium]